MLSHDFNGLISFYLSLFFVVVRAFTINGLVDEGLKLILTFDTNG